MSDTLYYDEVIQIWWSQHPKAVAHESGGFVRMQRGGMIPKRIMAVFKLEPNELVALLQRDIDLENDAHRRGRPIHSEELRRKGGRRR